MPLFLCLDGTERICYTVEMEIELTPEVEERIKQVREGTVFLGITGTQDGMTEAQFALVRELMGLFYMNEIHGGDCVGFDAECITLVKELRPDVKTVGHPPSNPNKRAFLEYDELREEKDYIARNHDIVDETIFLLACPNGPERLRSGTWATIRYARKQGKKVLIIYPDGKYTYDEN